MLGFELGTSGTRGKCATNSAHSCSLFVKNPAVIFDANKILE
jgi:hypothetical protein